MIGITNLSYGVVQKSVRFLPLSHIIVPKGAYISTSYIPTNETGLRIKYKYLELPSTTTGIMGSIKTLGVDGTYFVISFMVGVGKDAVRKGTAVGLQVLPIENEFTIAENNFLNSGIYKINNSEMQITTSIQNNNTISIDIFGVNGANIYFDGICEFVQISENDTLLFNGQAMLDTQDGVVGLYDSVTNEMFGSSSEINFIAPSEQATKLITMGIMPESTPDEQVAQIERMRIKI